ncbi:MAG: SpaH/EbpB family LPXTG-anchored major pilin [Lachnospiraceae bacterium]|nr:SpaH/EbpB family LPXTG-anchored major pilin [Lachnospiraceae bacterium]
MKNNIRKSVKRWLALVMTAMMLFSMATTVMAQGESSTTGYTITIENGEYNANTKYNLYRIYDATVTDSNSTIGVNYAITTDFTSLTDDYGADALKITDSNLEDLIEDAMSIVNKTTPPTATYSEMTAGTAIDVLPGYYLIVPVSDAADGGTVTSPCLVSVPGAATVDSDGSKGDDSKAVTVTPKASKTTIDKDITGGSTATTISSTGDSSTVAIGGTVVYTITSLIPDYGEDVDKTTITYTITDEADDTLDFVSVDSVIMSGTPDDVDLKDKSAGTGTVDNTYYSMSTSEHGFVLTFNYDQLTAGEEITIKATFELNKDAEINVSNDNEVTLEYTNNYYEGTTSEIGHEVKTYTFGFGINKIDETSSDPLTGAEFEIYNASGNLVATIMASATNGNVIITVYNGTKASAEPDDVLYSDEQTDNGSYAIKGLDAGSYTVKETKAPSGYSIGSDKTITIATSPNISSGEYDGSYTVNGVDTKNATFGKVTAHAVDINNKKGTTLPGTGGIGTTIFTFGGLTLVILAAIMFIVYTKKQRKQA